MTPIPVSQRALGSVALPQRPSLPVAGRATLIAWLSNLQVLDVVVCLCAVVQNPAEGQGVAAGRGAAAHSDTSEDAGAGGTVGLRNWFQSSAPY